MFNEDPCLLCRDALKLQSDGERDLAAMEVALLNSDHSEAICVECVSNSVDERSLARVVFTNNYIEVWIQDKLELPEKAKVGYG